ncbi:Polynucleotidyl transferase ribonuclease H fold [Echinococcus multilocularis]|uniref:Polynucleotidyl transferase ribonuclease H fold n=1 Tax=Echinococcus multilocularis TaxID=6211 RepID=A0A068XZU6_ECHMU|nr:Polynucleotidyl transferase ribonuclease H fold [Echinococcus multilocularis]
MVDHFTKSAEAKPMKSPDAKIVALVFFDRWISQHGVPESVHSAQGPNFESRLFIELSGALVTRGPPRCRCRRCSRLIDYWAPCLFSATAAYAISIVHSSFRAPKEYHDVLSSFTRLSLLSSCPMSSEHSISVYSYIATIISEYPILLSTCHYQFVVIEHLTAVDCTE